MQGCHNDNLVKQRMKEMCGHTMEIKKFPNENVKEMSLKNFPQNIYFFSSTMSKQCFISFCEVNITSSHEMKNQTISQGSKQQNYD